MFINRVFAGNRVFFLCSVIVHKVPDINNLNSTLSVAKFVRIAAHKNILSVENVIYDEELFVISKFDESMITLQNMIQKEQLEQHNINFIIHDVARALACMHLSGFVHKCVRSSNVIIYKGFAKLTGFYMSKDLHAQSGIAQDTESVIERIWLPKERINGSEYTTSCDVYSFGIMVIELYIGTPLIKIITSEQSIEEVRETLLNMFANKCHNQIYLDLIQECTNLDPKKRLRTCMSVVHVLDGGTSPIR